MSEPNTSSTKTENAHSPTTEASVSRPIFRTDALRHYVEAHETAVLPRWIAPNIFHYLWFIVIMLIIAGSAASYAQVPVYASGTAMIVDTQKLELLEDQKVSMAAFLPPEHLAQLQVGQTVMLHSDPTNLQTDYQITAVLPEIVSPIDAQQIFGNLQLIDQPSAVALITLDSLPSDQSATHYLGSRYDIDIEIGSQRLISLLPVISDWAGGV